MSIRTPPRYVVHPVHAPPARPRRWIGWLAAWLVSLLLVAGGTLLVARSTQGIAIGAGRRARRLAAEIDHLKQQLAIARRSQQVSSVATRKLTDNLAERDAQINGLRAEVALYSGLVGGGAQFQGIQLQTVHVSRLPHSRAWNITLSLTRNARRRDEESGTAEIDIDGVRAGSLRRLHWKDISAPDQKNGLAFKFKYFEQLHGTMMLPSDFTPNRLHVTLNPRNGHTITQSLSWTDALKHPENNHVEQ